MLFQTSTRSPIAFVYAVACIDQGRGVLHTPLLQLGRGGVQEREGACEREEEKEYFINILFISSLLPTAAAVLYFFLFACRDSVVVLVQ